MEQIKIGNFIAKCRKDKKLTQEQLAEKLHISVNAVSKWERGLNLPDYSNMQPLCDILGISLNEFFAGEHIKENEIKQQSDYYNFNIYFIMYNRQVHTCKMWLYYR